MALVVVALLVWQTLWASQHEVGAGVDWVAPFLDQGQAEVGLAYLESSELAVDLD